MSVHIPQPLEIALEGPIQFSGIPSTIDVNVDKLPKIQLGVDTLKVDVESLPKIQLGLDPVTLNPVTLNLAVTQVPNINLALTQIPNVRAHLPADYHLEFSLLGADIFGIRLTGEAQVITEPYYPNPCENCGGGPVAARGA